MSQFITQFQGEQTFGHSVYFDINHKSSVLWRHNNKLKSILFTVFFVINCVIFQQRCKFMLCMPACELQFSIGESKHWLLQFFQNKDAVFAFFCRFEPSLKENTDVFLGLPISSGFYSTSVLEENDILLSCVFLSGIISSHSVNIKRKKSRENGREQCLSFFFSLMMC